MADLGELKVPMAMRPAADAIIALTDEACAQLLDEEYAVLARNVVVKLARKRPQPAIMVWRKGYVAPSAPTGGVRCANHPLQHPPRIGSNKRG